MDSNESWQGWLCSLDTKGREHVYLDHSLVPAADGREDEC